MINYMILTFCLIVATSYIAVCLYAKDNLGVYVVTALIFVGIILTGL